MSYKLNKTNGDLLIELVDGKIDVSSTNLTLVGKNYQGFGEFINENFIKLLESFANTSQPSKPLRGQLWYDTSEGRLKVYTGSEFKSTDTTIYASSRPTSLVEGDIWIDGSNNQMYFYDGIEDVLVGPGYNKTQLKTGHFVETVKDITGINKVIVKLFINGIVIGVYAKEAFTPFPAIAGFGDLEIGFNISESYANFKFLGTATNAENLIDSLGVVYDPLTLFLRKDRATGDSTAGPITINANGGITVAGSSTSAKLYTTGLNAALQNTNGNFWIDLNNGTPYAMFFDKTNRRVGINNNNPAATVHIGAVGDTTASLIVEGDLTVKGATTYLDVSNLRVEDHQIELAIQSDSSLPTDAEVDQAGVIVRVTGDDKYLLWQNDTNKWDFDPGINLVRSDSTYSIDDAEVLSKTTLGPTVVNSNLTSLGTLSTLTIDDININGTRITCTNTLEISAVGSVDFLFSPKLINVGTPVSARIEDLTGGAQTEDDDDFVATKGYVDSELSALTKVFGLDVTGLGTTYAVGTADPAVGGDTTLQTNVGLILTELAPPTAGPETLIPDGAYARIHAVYYTASTDPIDVNTGVSKTLTAVDSAGVQNVNVIGDFTIASPTANVSLTVTRLTMVYVTNSNTWTWVSTTASAV